MSESATVYTVEKINYEEEKGKLSQAVTNYANITKEIETLRESLKGLLDEVEEKYHLSAFNDQISIYKKESKEIRSAINKMAEFISSEFQDDKPHEAIKIIYKTDIGEIDHDAAVSWCIENAPKFVQLDLSGLKKYAIGAEEAGAPLPFIKIEKVRQVNLSSKLEKFVTLKG